MVSIALLARLSISRTGKYEILLPGKEKGKGGNYSIGIGNYNILQ